jgi:branched-chain amino acid aminotransferase
MIGHISVTRSDSAGWRDLDWANLPFGRVFTDHMLIARYVHQTWRDVAVEPLRPLQLHPASSALHYGQEIFEGLKAFRQDSGQVVLFRPNDNWLRFNASCARMAMPEIPEEIFIDGLRELVRADVDWLPPGDDGALYLRPFMLGVDKSFLVKPAEEYLFVAIACAVGAYYGTPVRVTTAPGFARAFEGGTGAVKPAGNYGAAMLADREAKTRGFDSVLWLDARERRFIEECGVMNVFFVLDDVVVTPPLSGTILPGITRDSVMTVLGDAGVRVVERTLTIDEVLDAGDRGTLVEAFGSGTAATVVSIASITHGSRTVKCPPGANAVSTRALEHLRRIRFGREPDAHGWLMRI